MILSLMHVNVDIVKARLDFACSVDFFSVAENHTKLLCPTFSFSRPPFTDPCAVQ